MWTATSASGRTTSASSPCQRSGGAGARVALMSGPDRSRGRREAKKSRGRMKFDPRSRKLSRRQRGEIAEARGLRVLGVIGFDPGVLERCDFGEIGWIERSPGLRQKLRKVVAIGDHHRRPRPPRIGEAPRQRAKDIRSRRSAARPDSVLRARRSAPPRHCCDRPRTGGNRRRRAVRARPRAGARLGRQAPPRRPRWSPQMASMRSAFRSVVAAIAR